MNLPRGGASYDGDYYGGEDLRRNSPDTTSVLPASRPKEREIVRPEYFREDKLLTKGEVARLCRVDIRTVDRWVTAGKVSCQRTPSGRVLFRKHDVLTVILANEAPLRNG
jgi:hypothetical protein